MTHLLFFFVVFYVTGVRYIFYKVEPPRAEFWILYATILQLELEICIKRNELSIYPTKKKVGNDKWR